MSEVTAVLAISHRDLLKFLRDPARMVSTFVFPLIFIGALGGSLQATFGRSSELTLGARATLRRDHSRTDALRSDTMRTRLRRSDEGHTCDADGGRPDWAPRWWAWP